MSRIIKFRVWVKDERKMLYAGTWNFDDDSDSETESYHVMQFTGLKDKNGKEIYEGDVVEYFDWCYASADGDKIQKEFTPSRGDKYMNKWNPLKGVVKWNNDVQTYEPLVSCEEDYNNNCFAYVCKGDAFENYPESYFEVIGNIYETPNLLNESTIGK